MIKVKRTFGDHIFNVVRDLYLCGAVLLVSYPLLHVVANSLSDPNAVLSGKVGIIPKGLTTISYEHVFRYKTIINGYINSLFYMVSGTFVSIFFTMLLAYPLSRRDFTGRKWIMKALVFTMLFSGGLIPMFLVVQGVGMYNTRLALIIPGALGAWTIIVARTFLMANITEELHDAAIIDGASEFGFFFRFVLPLSPAILAVLALFTGVGIWNSYFDALIYLQDQELYPLQLVLRNILIIDKNIMPSMLYQLKEGAQALHYAIRYAIIVVASLPLLCLYPFVQRYFVKGVMVGSIKG